VRAIGSDSCDCAADPAADRNTGVADPVADRNARVATAERLIAPCVSRDAVA
jgi:hypothetical protein